MDCQTAIEYINLHVDNMLGDADTQRLFEHIRSCEHCKKELDKTIMLKEALSHIEELEPPAGLALGAIRKARKRRFPVFAYASAAVAAAIALVAIFSSSIFPNEYGNTAGSVAFDKSIAQDIEAPAAPPMPELAAAPAATSENGEGKSSAYALQGPEEDGMDRTATAGDSALNVTVPSNMSGLRGSLDSFMEKYDITPEYADESVVSFVVPEAGLSELETLIAGYGISLEQSITAGNRIEFTFEK